MMIDMLYSHGTGALIFQQPLFAKEVLAKGPFQLG